MVYVGGSLGAVHVWFDYKVSGTGKVSALGMFAFTGGFLHGQLLLGTTSFRV